MKTFVKVCVLALGVLAFAGRCFADSGSGSESLLYWMIDSKNEIDFDYAVVYATTEDLSGKTWTKDDGYGVADDHQVALPKIEGGIAVYEPKDGSNRVTLDILTELGSENWSSYSFYIELMQWDRDSDTMVRKGVSDWVSYTDLVKNNHVLGSGMTIPDNLVVWAPQTSTVPEPTSGVLALMGGALLMLRRRKE